MKRALILSVLCLFALSAAASDDSLTGGIGRMTGMGSPQITVPDSTSVIDLYESGNVAAIFARPVKSFIQLSPAMDMALHKDVEDNPTEETDQVNMLYLGSGYFGEKSSVAAVWFSPESVLVIKPYVFYGAGKDETTFPGSGAPSDADNLTQMLLAGEVEYGFKVNKGFSLGAVLGYSNFALTRKDTDGNDDYSLYSNKLIYAASAAFFLPADGADMTASLSFGNRTVAIPMVDMAINMDDLLEISYMIASPYVLSNFSSYSRNESATLVQEDFGSNPVTGFKADAGFAFDDKKGFEASVQAGALFGYTMKDIEKEVDTNKLTDTSVTTETTDDILKDGIGVIYDLKARKNFGIITPGLKVTGFNVASKIADDTSISYIQSGIGLATGASFEFAKGISVPVEYVFERLALLQQKGSDYGEISFLTNGVRGGIEYSFDSGLIIRGGADFTRGGMMEKSSVDGNVDESDPIGSEDNPAYDQLGFSAGTGFKSGDFEGNIGIRYQSINSTPSDPDLKSFNDSRLQVVTDIKFFIK